MKEKIIVLKPNIFTKRKVINDIRKYRFGEKLDTSSISGELKRYMDTQEKDKEAAANLVKDIYSKKPHFLLELIQNAEDNSYDKNIIPKIKFIFDENKIILQNNEIGFNNKNVWALCGIGETTKKKSLGFIGEKGIGFKSVFLISNSPSIFSNGYQFKFEYNSKYPLSIIKPYWIENVPDYVNWNETNIILPLSEKFKEEINEFFKTSPRLILFLNKIKKIIVDYKTKDKPLIIQKSSEGENILISYFNKKESWRLIRKSFFVPSSISSVEPKRLDIKETELILAFPITESGNAITTSEQNVHVYLPISSYGFRFIIHGDFLTLPDRERFHEDRQWNLWLRDQVSSVFLDAVNNFKLEDKLKKTYYNYIPIIQDIQGKLFIPVVEKIHENLLKSECIYTESNKWKKPTQIFSTSKEIRILISNEEVISFFGKEFIHPDVIIRKGILKALNIEEFKIDHLFQLLEEEKWLKDKSDEWFINLYTYLEQIELDYEQEEKLYDLKIIRLENNTLVSTSEINVFFPLEEKTKYSFENDLPVLKKNIYLNLPKDENGIIIGRNLLENLGVKNPSPSDIVKECILPLYRDEHWIEEATGDNVDHIRYIKENFKEIKNSYLLIDNIQNTILLRSKKTKKNKDQYFHPRDLYLSKEYGNENNLELLFEGIADNKFLHLQYIKKELKNKEKVKEWNKFLQKLGVNEIPKVKHYDGTYYEYKNHLGLKFKRKHSTRTENIEDYYLSEELKKILTIGDYKKLKMLLEIINKYWDKEYSKYNKATYNWFYYYNRRDYYESTFISEIRNKIRVPTTSKKLLRPNQVFLDRLKIRKILGNNAEYLAVDLNKELIKLLNVNTHADAKSVINLLIGLVKDNCLNKNDFIDKYAYLDNIPEEEQDIIYEKFAEHRIIFVPNSEQKYFSKNEVIWKDLTKIFGTKWPSLKKHYSKLKNFFIEKVGVRNEPDIKEYVDLLNEYANKGEVNEQEENIIFNIYQKLNKYLKIKITRSNVNSIEWWQDFIESPIFWTVNNVFWKNDGDLFINDDDSLYYLFNDKEDLTFLKLPQHFYPKIKYFIRASNISYLSKAVEAKLSINEKPKILKDLTDKIRSLIPYIKRYFYQFKQDIYQSILKKGVFEKLENLECKSVKKLDVEYKLYISYTGNKYSSKQTRNIFLTDSTLYLQEDNLNNFQIITIELMHFLENIRGLDDFLLILFQKELLSEIEEFLKLKNLCELPTSDLIDHLKIIKEEEIEETVEEVIEEDIEDIIEFIEDEKEAIDLAEKLLEEEILDDDFETDFEEDLEVNFREKEESTANIKLNEIEKSFRREEKIIEHKKKQLEENAAKFTDRKRKIEENKNKFEKLREEIQKEESLDEYQNDLRKVEEELNLVGKNFEYDYDPAEIAQQTVAEVLTNYQEQTIKLRTERKKLLYDIKTSKGKRDLISTKKTGFWGEEFVFEHLKKNYLDLYPDVKYEENNGIFKLLLDPPIIITYNNWARIESNKPYDIKINKNNKKIYIDVKATTTDKISPIEISRNELMKMYEKEDDYYIYRVLNADSPDAEIKIFEKPIRLWKEGKIRIIPETHSLLYY